MNTQKYVTLFLGLVTVALLGMVVIYAQVVWKDYRDRSSAQDMATSTAESDEPPAPLTPEENLEVLNSLATTSATSSEDIVTVEKQTAILNSLSTGTPATTTDTQ